MEEVENPMPVVTFSPAPCPECGKDTNLINLGEEPPREVCLSLSCEWNGVKLLG